MSARYGGEEFVIVLPDVTEADAVRVAEAVRLTVRSLGIPNSAASRGYVTISVGVSTRTAATLDQAMLVGDADLALYEAKRLGRNRCFSASALKHAFVESGPLQPDAPSRTRDQALAVFCRAKPRFIPLAGSQCHVVAVPRCAALVRSANTAVRRCRLPARLAMVSLTSTAHDEAGLPKGR